MAQTVKPITFGTDEPSIEAARKKALQLISAFNLDKSIAKKSTHYPEVLKQGVVEGLKIAINESEDSIHQGHSSLCGPAAFFFHISRKRPDIYVQVVLDLYKNGEAKLEKLKLKSSAVAKKTRLSGIKGIDWMIMSSIKPSYDKPADRASGITWPGDLGKWLKNTGYQVVDRTAYTSRGLESLLQAQLAYASGHTVFLFVNGALFRQSGKNAISFYPNHWVILNSDIKIKKYDNRSKSHKAPAVISSTLIRDISEEWKKYEEAMEEFNDIDGERFDRPVKINNQILLDVFTWGKRHWPVFNERSISRKPEIGLFLKGYYGYIKAKR